MEILYEFIVVNQFYREKQIVCYLLHNAFVAIQLQVFHYSRELIQIYIIFGFQHDRSFLSFVSYAFGCQ